MHNSKILISVLLLGACAAPEQQLATHVDEVADLYRTHRGAPQDGIRALHVYLQNHLSDIEGHASAVKSAVQSAGSPEDRSARAQKALTVLKEPLAALEREGRAFRAQAARDAGVQQVIESLGPAEVERLHTAHNGALQGTWSMLQRELRAPITARLLARAVDLQSRACACKDARCKAAVTQELEAFDQKNRGIQVPPATNRSLRAALKKAGTCLGKAN